MAEIPDALVEKAAKAIALAGDDGCFDCEFCGGDPGPDDYCSCAEDRDYNRKLAVAALAALDDAGYRIEPKTRMAYLCTKCDTTFVDFYPSSRVSPHECPEDCMADHKGEE